MATGWDEWDWYYSGLSLGALHEVRAYRFTDPILSSGRPIGFLANIDQKPVYRVSAVCVPLPVASEDDI